LGPLRRSASVQSPRGRFNRTDWVWKRCAPALGDAEAAPTLGALELAHPAKAELPNL
jgi:hypothetical protein